MNTRDGDMNTRDGGMNTRDQLKEDVCPPTSFSIHLFTAIRLILVFIRHHSHLSSFCSSFSYPPHSHHNHHHHHHHHHQHHHSPFPTTNPFLLHYHSLHEGWRGVVDDITEVFEANAGSLQHRSHSGCGGVSPLIQSSSSSFPFNPSSFLPQSPHPSNLSPSSLNPPYHPRSNTLTPQQTFKNTTTSPHLSRPRDACLARSSHVDKCRLCRQHPSAPAAADRVVVAQSSTRV